MATGLSSKTQSLIDELTQYKTDYIALAKEIYKDGRTPTEEEIDNLNTLLEKIGEVRIKLNEAQDSATQVLKARTERVKQGQGTENDFGEAVGYTQQKYANQAADQHAANESTIAQYQTDIDAWKASLASGKLTADEMRATATNIQEAQNAIDVYLLLTIRWTQRFLHNNRRSFKPCLTGWRKRTLKMRQRLTAYATLYDQYQQLMQDMLSGDGLEVDEKKRC